MITYIKINGFKSFHNFEMEFTPLTVVAGVNASGKSNLFDALQLLARLAEVDFKTAFSEQRGNPNELFTQYDEDHYASEMEFIVEMLVNRNVRDNWGGEAELKYTRLRYKLKLKRIINERGFEDLQLIEEYLENLEYDQDKWTKKQTSYIATNITNNNYNQDKVILVTQEKTSVFKAFSSINHLSQTILSYVNSVDFAHAFAAKKEMISWKLLQLNPQDLREPTRQDLGMRDTITQSGKNLAAALFRIKQDDEYNLVGISRTLNNLLPNLTEVNVYNDQANAQFIIKIKGDDGREFSSRVLSEGTLRLLTLCILQYDNQHTGLLCFEEPENGIHPFGIKTMAELLKDLTVDFENPETPLRQVIVNTHSPVLVKELIQWKDDQNVSIWFSFLESLITKIEDQRIKIKVTKILPVDKEDKKQLTLPFTEQEYKLTMLEVIKYLQTADSEQALNIIKD